MQSLLSYAQAYGVDYDVRLVDVHITKIMYDMMCSNLLDANFRASYV